MSNLIKELQLFLNASNRQRLTIFFKDSDAHWMNYTGLKVPFRFSSDTRQLQLTKSRSIKNVITIDISLDNSSSTKIAIKLSVLQSILNNSSDIIIDDSHFNLLQGSDIKDLKLYIKMNSFTIIYSSRVNNYFVEFSNITRII